MTLTAWLAGLSLAAFAVALVLVYLRLRWWARRCEAVEQERDEAWQPRVRAMGTESLWLKERLDIEDALTRLWPRLAVQTPEEGAAVAVLRAAFPSLPAPGDGLTTRDVTSEPAAAESPTVGSTDARATCPTCSDTACVAPGHCDDPGYFFGGDGP
ncbi:hypothetical protein [Myxococcus virescens]|uniref:Uncharacterized protein n=1 Tax=Myxococcus virescens TaxID=83456 RepID=A0A511HPA8_9BACT|nr:hypothetical protein [Myxococcus virescens]GEL75195.1 hypothetical protein MVI01_69790 [Myxococcus virescens]SDD64957.1 hypothetical protein SAMN04488504_102120 [Myxococcus virescens]